MILLPQIKQDIQFKIFIMTLFSSIFRGTSPNDNTGDKQRDYLGKINDNFDLAANTTETNNFTSDQGFGTATPTHQVSIESAGDNIFTVIAKGTGFGGSHIAELYSERTSTTPNPVLRVGSAFSVDAFIIETSGEMVSLPTYGNTTGSAANVYVDTNGRFFRSTSSKEIKKEIKYNVDHELVLKLKPATFTEKSTGKKFIGFVAEDVNEIDERFATNQKEKGLMGLDSNAILAAAISKIQDLEKRLSVLESK